MQSLVVYKLESPVEVVAEMLEQKLFRECGANDMSTNGFHPTMTGELVIDLLGGNKMLCFATQQKKPAKGEIKKGVDLRTTQHIAEFGVPPEKEEIAAMKEEVIWELLPKTGVDEVKLASVLITSEFVYVEGNYKKAEVITDVLRDCLGSLPITLIDTANDVSDTLTRFVGEQVSDKFTLMDKCQLVTAEDRKIGVAKDLYDSEAVDLVEAGAKVKSVQLEYDGIMSLTVKDNLSLSGIKIYPALTSEFDEEEIVPKLEKQMTELDKMFKELLEEMGGILDEETKDC